ncbi:uncharacterized protein LOC130894789 [Diorhabda carinulata]|uniref:uncharacterized protein LOC130894789 n=1 Tax=Diorhabda carinulata TaxID=1163345 RepID=UPI0025A310E6|nr:uncharacterized protein LOC130894789 [Diorhabda carinulata]
MRTALWTLLIIAILKTSIGQGDSLRSALNAIDRRQRDLGDYEDSEYGYTLERPEDLVFLNSPGYGRERPYERPLLNYRNEDKYEAEINKRISSAFRERVEEDNQRQQLEEMAQNIINNMESRGRYNVENEDYDEILRELWDKYKIPYERTKVNLSPVEKRMMYPRFGLDSVGLKKRNPYGEVYDDNYGIGDESYDDDGESYYPYARNRYYQGNKISKFRQMYGNPYSQAKRFPVTKRSSELKDIHEHKRSTTKKQTDPKVEKDLSNIFGNPKKEEKETTTKKPLTIKPTTPKKEVVTKSPKETNAKVIPANNEQFTPVSMIIEKPLQIKKKSIDWSDYFGLDRRKKSSDPDDLDKEWLIERYHKSINLSNKKRNADLPLSSFHNHDDPRKKATTNEKDKYSSEEQKINEMDAKLQRMEDKIVDDTLKYTGAHEGETDPKEVQEIKDKVISRLAAAYSLEKMRAALGEYRLAVAKEREKLKSKIPTIEDGYLFSEEKRTAVPRKYVIDKDREETPEGDNNIKCSEGDEDCHEQNYKTPNEIFENHYGTEVCPAIVRSCNEGAVVAGDYGQVFKSACHMHEMCLLCSNNSWFPPTRQCHSLFLAKAFDLCKGDQECQKFIQRSIRYLLDVTRFLHAEEPSVINDCEMSCPETEALLEPTSRWCKFDTRNMQNENLYSNMENISLDHFSMQDNTYPVYPEYNQETVITQQPTENNYPGSRRPIPVSVIEQDFRRTISPTNGLGFLLDVNQLIIQQTIELVDLIANVASENRYTVKVPRGDTIYYATESSSNFQRNCLGSGRSFSMRLYDKTQQEALIFERRLACGTCTFWCYLQKMEVWIPPGELVGTISQNISISMKTSFNICNRHDEIIYKIEGPNSFGCILGKSQNFQIFNYDGSTQIGSIIYQWDNIQVSYNLLLQMPSNITETRHKALLLGSAFLLEYMYFEQSKKKTYCRCIC